jgi:hypothetical protein
MRGRVRTVAFGRDFAFRNSADESKVACLLEKHNYAEPARILVVDPHASFDR